MEKDVVHTSWESSTEGYAAPLSSPALKQQEKASFLAGNIPQTSSKTHWDKHCREVESIWV